MHWALGLAIGLPLGFVLHRGDFCMRSVLRDVLGGRPGSSVHAYLLALAVDLVAVQVLVGAELVPVTLPGLTALGAVVGGLMLGAGMVLSRA